MLLSEHPNSRMESRGRGRIIMLGGVGVVATFIAFLAITQAWKPPAPGPMTKNVEELYNTEVIPEVTSPTEFMTSRRLAQAVALNLDVKCEIDQPLCNPEVEFASAMNKLVGHMKKFAPDVYEILKDKKLTKSHQEFVIKLVSLAHNTKLLQLGEIVAKTVKRWDKSGSKVVHEKVKEAIDEYYRTHGGEGIPKMDSSNTGNASMWLSRVDPEIISDVREEGDRKLTDADVTASGIAMQKGFQKIGAIVGAIVGAADLLGVIYLILEILHYTGQLELGLQFRKVVIWIYGFVGSIECLGIVTCPFVFLAYWLDVWLSFGRKPSEMKGIPWDFMMKNLPGLNGKSRLLAADPRVAA